MSNHNEIKTKSKEKMNELYAKYELIQIKARKLSAKQQDELKDNISSLEAAKKDLEDKWSRVDNFGEEATEELSKAFTTSAEAFENETNQFESRIKD